jgi:hypothetical protein
MISFLYADLLDVAKERPDGYVDAVLAKASRNGDHVIMDERDYAGIQRSHPKQVSKAFLDSFTEAAVATAPTRELSEKARRLPTWDDMISNLATAAVQWAKSGFKLASADSLGARKRICCGTEGKPACDFWDQSKYFGSGGCLKCGCSTAKLYLATSECPIGKWGMEKE